jgi:hypothetical protein
MRNFLLLVREAKRREAKGRSRFLTRLKGGGFGMTVVVSVGDLDRWQA